MTAPPTPNGRERARPRGAADSVLPSRSFWSSTGRGVRRHPPGQLGVSSRGPVPPREAPATPGGGASQGHSQATWTGAGRGPPAGSACLSLQVLGCSGGRGGGPSGTAESSPGDSAVGARGICAPARAGFDSPEIHRPPQAGHTVRGRWWGHVSPGAERPPCLGPGRTARAPTLTGPAPRPGPSHTASGGLHGHAVGGAAWLRVAVCPGLCPLGLDHPSRSEPPPPPCQAQQGGRTAPPHPSAGLPQSLKSPPQQSGQSWPGKRWPLPQTPTLSHHLPGVLLCHKRGVCYPPPGGAMPAEGQHGPPHRPPAQGGELGSLDPCSVHTDQVSVTRAHR